jgi:predicted neuraminidase
LKYKKRIKLIKTLYFLIALFSLFSIADTSAQISLVKISEAMVYDSPPFKECHASSIVEVTPNQFLIAAFGGSKEGKDDVSIWLSHSDKNEWKAPQLIDRGVSLHQELFPCWNPVLFQSQAGTLSLFYKVGPSPREWWGMVKTSDDRGNTWSEGKRLAQDILGPIKNKPVQLRDGTILSPSSTETRTSEGLSWKVHIEKSTNDGRSWTKIPIDPTTEFDVIQPSILLLGEKRLQILCRSRNNSLMQAFSEDNGNSWGPVTRTDLPNPNAGTDAITLSNGYHLLVYNPTQNGKNGRSKLSVALSQTGKDWEEVLFLENEKKGEFSYPAVIESADGKVHISYTYNRRNIKHVVLEINERMD